MLTDISKLKSIGPRIKIFEMAKIVNPHVVEIGEGAQIDDFTFINGGAGVTIGRYAHIGSFTTIIGGGRLVMEDYAGISAGCRIITGTQGYDAGRHMVPTVPPEKNEPLFGTIVMKKDSFLGSNAIVFPNVTIGEGAVVAAGSIVTQDVAPWTINVGNPLRTVALRPQVIVD